MSNLVNFATKPWSVQQKHSPNEQTPLLLIYVDLRVVEVQPTTETLLQTRTINFGGEIPDYSVSTSPVCLFALRIENFACHALLDGWITIWQDKSILCLV